MSSEAGGHADALARLGQSWGRRTYVMGILNATPDSFSGDGLLQATDPERAAVEQAEVMVAAGADLLDIGGESTRPGAPPVTATAEAARVLPVVEAVRAAVRVPISIDTRCGAVAAAALAAGAGLVNDVSGGEDPALLRAVADTGVPLVLMASRRGAAGARQVSQLPAGGGAEVMDDTVAWLERAIARALAAGVARSRLIVDPGYGFGGPPAVQFALLRYLPRLRRLGLPILVGTSRKSSLALLLGESTPEALLHATTATVALAVAGGADMVRVHDVAAMARVVRVSDAVVRGDDAHDRSHQAGA